MPQAQVVNLIATHVWHITPDQKRTRAQKRDELYAEYRRHAEAADAARDKWADAYSVGDFAAADSFARERRWYDEQAEAAWGRYLDHVDRSL